MNPAFLIAGPVLEVLALLQEEGITPETLRAFPVGTGERARVCIMVSAQPEDVPRIAAIYGSEVQTFTLDNGSNHVETITRAPAWGSLHFHATIGQEKP